MNDRAGLSILLVRMSALGDVIHTLPLAWLLRRAFPSAIIDWAVDRRYAGFLSNDGALDAVIPVDRADPVVSAQRIRQRAAEISESRRAGGYSHSIDPQGLFKSALASLVSGARVRIGFDIGNSREGSWLFSHHRIDHRAGGDHVAGKNLALAGAVGVLPEEGESGMRHGSVDERPWRRGSPIDPGVQAWETSCAIFESLGIPHRNPGDPADFSGTARCPVALFSPGAGWPTKVWPTERYSALAGMLCERGFTVLVLWAGQAEEAMAMKIAGGSGAVMLPATNLETMLAMVAMADLVVAGDTGPLHAANFQNTPVAGIYLASDPVRNGPWYRPSLVVTPKVPCHPCMGRSCPDPVCLGAIEPAQVMAAIEGRYLG